MECKEVQFAEIMGVSRVLIETLWNVKICFFRSSVVVQSVLIETLWNVKMLLISVEIELTSVLIETLWNVKLTSTGYVRREAKY